MFRDEYANAALGDDAPKYAAGYANRAVATYNYVLNLDDAISNATIDKAMAAAMAGGGAGGGTGGRSSDSGFNITMRSHGKHADFVLNKLPKGKTFCEPVYPDLITVSDCVPPWLLEKANIPTEKMIDTGMLVYSIPTQVLKDACGGDLNAILGGVADAKERQRVFDPNNYKKEFKKQNPGKPANNNEPFPVDLKIEELETHKPTIKIHTITTCPEAVEAAKAVLRVSDTAEKRIVKLENMMATMARYLFRMSSRVHINCVYYGGQTSFEKYNAIRCLTDDRLSDGQSMSMDQCLNCTRYEPILGQVYEIMNDLGTNLATILDDNQMGYANMKDYVDFTRVENFHKEKDAAKIDMATITKRDATEKDFKDMWPKGVEMKWDLVPVEEQKPHINWRQSINDDGTKLKKLSSFPQDENNTGTPITTKPVNANIMQKNANSMNTNTKVAIQPPIETGKMSGVTLPDELINKMKAGLEKEIRSKLNSNTDVDPLIIAAIMQIEKVSDPAPIIQRYSEVMTTLGIKNPAIVISAYKAEPTTFLGNDAINPKLPRIDQVVRAVDSTSSSSTTPTTFNLNWESRETWLWTDFCEPMMLNLKAINAPSMGIDSFFPSVCYMYLELAKVAKTSRFDGEVLAFPFIEDQLNGIWYVSPFGLRDGKPHQGIDLAPDNDECFEPIHACKDGIAYNFDYWGPWNGLGIKHEGGFATHYLHCSEILVNEGDTVRAGDVIAKTGGYGQKGPRTYSNHLHVEIWSDASTSTPVDPLTYWPLLNGKLGGGEVSALGLR